MKNEKPMDYIAFCLCWGLARYDANEACRDAEGTGNQDRTGHSDSDKD